MSEHETYTLAQIRSGSGWPKGARFALVQPETTTAVYARVAAEPSPPEAVEAQRAAVMAAAEAAGLAAEDFTEDEWDMLAALEGPAGAEDVRAVLMTAGMAARTRGCILHARRCCQQARQASSDAMALAYEGRLAEAAGAAGEAERFLGAMRDALADAAAPEEEGL